jgi:ketosteroid isomerase-like protein
MNTVYRFVSKIGPILAASLACVVWSASRQADANSGKNITTAQFRDHMRQLADAWNRGNARAAADFFAKGALYSSAPNSGAREGRQALFEWFGGTPGRPKPMQMEWHHLVFDEEMQIGAGEYTFTYEVRTHGMALIRLRDGKIANWREYELESPLDWEAMIGKNRF